MKFSCVFSLLALFVSSGIAAAQTAPELLAGTSVVSATTQEPTSAQQRIAAAKQQVKAHPKDAQPYVELALAWIRRARETANPVYFNDAEQAITAGLAFTPSDFQLAKAHAALLLGRHEFAQARTEATALNRRTPDDVTTYAYLAEANIALGEYPDAEEAAQWMLNLLPNNLPGLMLGAQLRDVYGDPEGAWNFSIRRMGKRLLRRRRNSPGSRTGLQKSRSDQASWIRPPRYSSRQSG